MAGMTWRYFKFNISAVISGTEAAMESLILSATSGGSQLLTGGTATASSEFSGTYVAANAFTATTDYWYSQAGGALPHWIKYDLGSGNTATPRYIKLTPYTGVISGGFYPTAFTLQGSDDDSSWTTLLTASGVAYQPTDRWYAGSDRTIEIPFGHKIAGNSTHSDTDPTHRVVVFDWTTGRWIDTVTPDGAGDFETVFVGSGDVGVVHIGDSGYQPRADGPITPSAR